MFFCAVRILTDEMMSEPNIETRSYEIAILVMSLCLMERMGSDGKERMRQFADALSKLTK